MTRAAPSADLREWFRRSWATFRDAVVAADPDRVTSSGWTVKDMLGHVAFWMEAVPRYVTGMWRGDPSAFERPFPSGYVPEAEWPRAAVHNAREAAWARERGDAEVLERLDRAARELGAFFATVTDAEATEHADYFAEAHDHLDEHLPELIGDRTGT